ncbi:hypothetical protein FOMPIDRAFT_1123576, partial [Fomitopsis schrenkii]
HLSVVDVVVSFSIRHGLGPICDWVPQSVWKLLRYDSTHCVPQRINFYSCRTVWFPCHYFSLLRSPVPGNIFLGQVVQWARGLSEVVDEAAIEVGEPKESPHLAKILRCRPLGDCFDFYVIHLDLPFTDHKA